jgi:pyruvate dehydrogenase (quinone)
VQDWEAADGHRSLANIAKHSGDIFTPANALPTQAQLQEAADLINAGSKVAILVGRGCLGARQEVEQLADTVAGPVIKALLGKAVLPDDSPYTTGGTGLLGTSPSADALKECDTFIIAGSSFPYIEFLPKPGQAKAVQIDVDPTRIGLRYPVDVGIVGDCKRVLAALLPLLQRKQDRGFLEKAQKNMRDWNEVLQTRGPAPPRR